MKISKFWKTVLFYVAIIALNTTLSYLFPLRPCADIPSSIVFIIVLGTLILSLVLLCKSFIKIIKKDKDYYPPFIVHIIFWIGFIVINIVTA